MEILDTWSWRTHQPIIKVALSVYKPNYILEMGIGNNSTPLFIDYLKDNESAEYCGVENDLIWVKKMEERYDQYFIYHDIKTIAPDVPISALSDNIILNISNYYKKLKVPNTRPKLLFVDNYVSCRSIVMNAIGQKFDIIIFHDCAPYAYKFYGYDLVKLKNYSVRYLESTTSWTGIMVKKSLSINKVDNNISKYINEFVLENNEAKGMVLS